MCRLEMISVIYLDVPSFQPFDSLIALAITCLIFLLTIQTCWCGITERSDTKPLVKWSIIHNIYCWNLKFEINFLFGWVLPINDEVFCGILENWISGHWRFLVTVLSSDKQDSSEMISLTERFPVLWLCINFVHELNLRL